MMFVTQKTSKKHTIPREKSTFLHKIIYILYFEIHTTSFIISLETKIRLDISNLIFIFFKIQPDPGQVDLLLLLVYPTLQLLSD